MKILQRNVIDEALPPPEFQPAVAHRNGDLLHYGAMLDGDHKAAISCDAAWVASHARSEGTLMRRTPFFAPGVVRLMLFTALDSIRR